MAICSAARTSHSVSQPAFATKWAGQPDCIHVHSLQTALASAHPELDELRGLHVACGIPDGFDAFPVLRRLSLHGWSRSFAPSQLPATLVELTLHDGAAEQPLRVGHLTQLTLLTLIGTAYLTLVSIQQAGVPPDAPPTVASLPKTLRTLGLRDCHFPRKALDVVGDLHRQLAISIPMLELQFDAEVVPQWLVYQDTTPRMHRPSHGARLPAGFSALRLRGPRVDLEVMFDLGSVPDAPPDAAEMLCRLFAAAPRSYRQFYSFVAPGGLIASIRGSLERIPIMHTCPVLPGDADERFKSAEALTMRMRQCPLGLLITTATIDGEECVVSQRA